MIHEPTGVATKHLRDWLYPSMARRADAMMAGSHVEQTETDIYAGIRSFAANASDAEIADMAHDLFWIHQSLDPHQFAPALNFESAAEMLDASGPFESMEPCPRCGGHVGKLARSEPSRWAVTKNDAGSD